jgi:S1-C subfamily serine protease
VGASVALGVAALAGAFDRQEAAPGAALEVTISTVAPSSPGSASFAVTPDVSQLVAEVTPAILRVEVPTLDGGRVGSGVLIDADGTVITSHDLVDGTTEVEVVDSWGRVHVARVVGSDPESGLAVLSVEADDLIAARLAEHGPDEVGSTAIVVGAPTGLEAAPTVAVGVVSGLGKVVPLTDDRWLYGMIQVDTRVPLSASGGAVLDLNGALIAVSVGPPTGAAASRLGIDPNTGGLAVPIDVARSIAAQIRAEGMVRYSWLGIAGGDLDSSTSVRLGVGGGAVVTRLDSGAPAARAGLLEGDVITAVDGMAISGMVGLMTEIRAAPIGTSVDLTIVRSPVSASDPDSTAPASTQPAGTVIEEAAVLKLTVLLTARPER